MARRKKEEPEAHQDRIAGAAGRLFMEKGIQNTTMDEVAAAAGYSKATLYVYFKNKEDIAAFQAWKSMVHLKDIIARVVMEDGSYKDRFVDMGLAAAEYAEKYSEYSRILMKPIRLSTDGSADDFYARTFRAGEEINRLLLNCLEEGRAEGILKNREYQIADVFQLWGMISGLIQITQQKQEYIRTVIGEEKEEFLREGLEKLYQLIEA